MINSCVKTDIDSINWNNVTYNFVLKRSPLLSKVIPENIYLPFIFYFFFCIVIFYPTVKNTFDWMSKCIWVIFLYMYRF